MSKKGIAMNRVLSLTCFALVGCTSMQSSMPQPGSSPADGLTYFLPNRSVQVKVVVSADGAQTPTVESGDNEPDLSRTYVLSYQQNLLGKNTIKLTTNAAGLLMSTTSATVSGVSDAAKALGKLAGTLTALGESKALKPPTEIQCQKGQTYTMVLRPGIDSGGQICMFSVEISPLGTQLLQSDSERVQQTGTGHAGLFYRRDLPYKVSLNDGTGPRQFVAYSPNESPTFFFPITRSFFADSNATLTFSSPGVLTGVDQSADGEIVAAVKLPADVISEYFKAIGAIFTQFSDNSDKQAKAVTNTQALALAQAKQQFCVSTIAANPIVGKSEQEAATALAAIKAACQ
jgi:hypothetical protein